MGVLRALLEGSELCFRQTALSERERYGGHHVACLAQPDVDHRLAARSTRDGSGNQVGEVYASPGLRHRLEDDVVARKYG
jgi:hypothetical protein